MKSIEKLLRDFVSACENEPDGENYRPHIGKSMVDAAKRALEEESDV